MTLIFPKIVWTCPLTHSDILDLPHSVPIVDLFLPGFHEDFMMGRGGGGGGTLSCT